MMTLISQVPPQEGSICAAKVLPSCAPTHLSSEHVDLQGLVHHRHSVAHDLPLEQVHCLFRATGANFAALVQEGKVTGICSRERLGIILGSRFGFALNAKSPAHAARVAHPLVVVRSTPIRRVLDQALARAGAEFHEDVALVDEADHLLGLIPVCALSHLQTRLVAEQLGELYNQQEKLRQQNLALFQVNHALRQAQGLYQGLFESDALGVALLDLQGNLQTHNRRLAELLQLDADSPGSHSLSERIIERQRAHFLELLRRHEGDGQGPTAGEFRLEMAGQSPRLFRIFTGWIRETGQVCACIDDITEQRSLEQKMQRQEKQILLDGLVGGIAHELNNKLTPVLGFAGLLASAVAEPERGYVGYISQSVAEAARIIQQLLQLSKPAAGVQQFQNLLQSVEEALVMLKFELREHGVVLRFIKPSAPVTVLADHSQLKQVVINLAINAIHAMEHRPAKVLEIEVGRDEEDAYVAIRDNGMGIAPEIIGRIFDPFFTTKSADRGSGLGLSICLSIMRQHGGDLSVESEPGQGARFLATLPIALAGASVPALAHGSAATVSIARPRTGRRRVLVVEDEDVVRQLMQETLRTYFACAVDSVLDGREGLHRAEVCDYDLIISDIRMPGMNGTEFFQCLQTSRPTLAARFVFVTGHVGHPDQSKMIARWCVPVIAKPFSIDHLVAVCAPFLSATPPGAQGANGGQAV